MLPLLENLTCETRKGIRFMYLKPERTIHLGKLLFHTDYTISLKDFCIKPILVVDVKSGF